MSSKESNCKSCSKSISNLAYQCNYCGSTFCQEHRIPENHDCVGLELVVRNDEQWGLGLLDVDSEPSKEIGVDQAVQVIEEKRSKEEVESKQSADIEDEDSTSDYMDPEVREKAQEVVDLLDNSAPDIDEYKQNPESAYDTVEPMVYSSAVEPEFDSSPDVSLDGSIKTDEDSEGNTRTEVQYSGRLFGMVTKRILIFVVLSLIAGAGYYVLYL